MCVCIYIYIYIYTHTHTDIDGIPQMRPPRTHHSDAVARPRRSCTRRRPARSCTASRRCTCICGHAGHMSQQRWHHSDTSSMVSQTTCCTTPCCRTGKHRRTSRRCACSTCASQATDELWHPADAISKNLAAQGVAFGHRPGDHMKEPHVYVYMCVYV